MQQDQSLNDWEQKFTDYLESSFENDDKSHDISHFQRVWKIAQEIMNDEADKLVILAGAYFHDIVCYPKNDPRRSLSSVDAGIKAMEILKEMDFPEDKLENVKHAIEAHSFSAGIAPKTIEAKVLQDADRMESLGALGLARTFYTAGRMGSKLFDENDPLAENRSRNDKLYALDHFETKLLKLPDLMQTQRGRSLASKRAQVLKNFVTDLKSELFL